jgi:hypothetical protein
MSFAGAKALPRGSGPGRSRWQRLRGRTSGPLVLIAAPALIGRALGGRYGRPAGSIDRPDVVVGVHAEKARTRVACALSESHAMLWESKHPACSDENINLWPSCPYKKQVFPSWPIPRLSW